MDTVKEVQQQQDHIQTDCWGIEDQESGTVGGSKPMYDLFKTPHKFQPRQTSKKTPKRKFSEDKEEQNRPRTPSGQPISNSIDAIKHMLEKRLNPAAKKHVKDCDQHGYSQSECVNTNADCMQSSVTNGAEPMCDYSTRTITTVSENKVAECEVANTDLEEVSTNKHLGSQTNCNTNITADRMGVQMEVDTTDENTSKDASVNNLATVLFDGKNQKVASDIEDAVKAAAADYKTMPEKEQPQTVDIRVVVQMLEELKEQVKTEKYTKMEEKMQKMEKGWMDVNSKVNVCDAKQQMIARTMAHLKQTVDDLQSKLEVMDINSGKRTVVLAGFEADSKIPNCKEQLYEFFSEVMEIEVTIEDLYFIGQNNPRDIVIIMLSNNHKRAIFRNIDRIKNLTNSQGKRYIFRDLLTQNQLEVTQKESSYCDMR